MIKAVVFDFGGVIQLNDGDFNGGLLSGIAKLIGAPDQDFKEEYFKHNHLSNVGNEPWETMISKVISRFTQDEDKKAQALSFVNEFQSHEKMNEGLLAMLPSLRRQGLKIGILSNATSKLRERLDKEGISRLVDQIVISGEIGFQKPDKEAFQAVFEKLQVLPQETVFVDDASKSLENSAEIGYIPIQFQNNDQLKTELKALGISTD